MGKVRNFIKEVIDIIFRPYMRILPGQLAFFILMSFIPLLALVGSIANYFSLSVDTMNEISKMLPFDLSMFLTNNAFVGKGLNFNIIIFFISAFLIASNGMHSVIITANEIYNYQDEGVILRRVKAIAMTFVIVGLLLFLLLVTIFGNYFFELLREYNVSSVDTIDFFETMYNYLKLPISILLIFYNIKQLFKMAPDTYSSSKTPTYAAIFTTIVWIIGTEIYSIYVKFFSNYNLFYGSISNIIILMVWIYFLAYVFVLGMGLSTIDIEKNFFNKDIEK